MFYLSRAEQVALFLLLALLLSGAGLLAYHRGVQAGWEAAAGPLVVDPPPRPTAPAAQPEGVAPPASAGLPGPETSSPLREPAPARQPPSPTPRWPISLNRATAEQLEALPGIGPVYARRIIELRERRRRANGIGFESVDELLDVPGIGPKRLAAVKGYVVP